MAQKKQGKRKRQSRVGQCNAEGEKPVDFIAHFARLTAKQRQIMFDQVTASSRISCKSFLENRENNRVPVPLHEKKRVVLTVAKQGDGDYYPATYACCERDDYILSQAPTKGNYRDFWRMLWRDGCKICVSLSDKVSAADDSPCYPYWPMKEGEKMEIEGNRFVIECSKRTEMKGYVVYDLRVMSTDPGLDATTTKSAQKVESPEEVDEKKWRLVTLMHYNAWPSDEWPDLDSLGPFVHALSKKEIQVMRKSLDNYIPPVVIQSYDALGRAPVVWVSTILMKEIEKKECFDVEDLAKRCSRARPGAFYKRLHFCVLMALSFRLASLGGWTALEEARKKIKDIESAYQESVKK